MTDNKVQTSATDRPEQAKPEQTKPEEGEEQARQSQSGLPTQPAQRTVPGRRPLFRN